MRYLSVCSGIEAATVAWHPLGWETAAFSEIEAFPRAVLKHHYPDTPLHGDFTTIGADEYGAVDLLVGGTPCQSFSVAGLRGGIHDSRGNLALEYLRLLDRKRPRWMVWENVPGVYSATSDDAPDHGDDGDGRWEDDADESHAFACFLAGLRQLGYHGCYRTLDAQYFGVPQRRRRVFVVGYLGDWRRAAAVLFERHSLSGHPAPRREKGQDASDRLGFSTVGSLSGGYGSKLGTDESCQGSVIPDWPAQICPTLDTYYGDKMGLEDQHVFNQRGGKFVPVAYQTSGNAGAWETGPITGALDTNTDPCSHVICFGAKEYAQDAAEDISPTLRSGSHSGSHANGGVMPAVAFAQNSRDELREMPYVGALAAEPGMKQQSFIRQSSAVRRLTPRECERLQGFPEMQKSYTILLCRDLSDQQKANALAALQCRKSQSNAWTADASGWMLSAEAAAHHSSTSLADPAPPVAVDVLIDLERQEVRLHSAARSMSSAVSAGEQSAFPLPTGITSFAQLAVLLTHGWVLAMQDGRVASPANTTPSTHPLSGSSIAIPFGRETGEPAADVATAIEMAIRFSTFTTLPSGADIESLRSTLETLCSCVAHAIAGFIPEQTAKASCFAVRLTTSQGYTLIPYRGKPAADGPRYKALGNSMAVPVMRFIGERIAAVEALASQSLAA